MKKRLSICKIHTIVRVARLKKTSAAVNICIVFSIGFSSFFREKSMQNHVRNVKNVTLHRNRQRIHLQGVFWGSLWVPGGLLGRPRGLPEASIFSSTFG